MAGKTEVSNEDADENIEKEENIIGLGCSKDSFTEHEEVEKLIDQLLHPICHSTATDFRFLELTWQRFSFILDQYQEQPHLIDSHLDAILEKIIKAVREENLGLEVKHMAFRCLYYIAKVRGYKVVARHLTHEVADLEPLLNYLEGQDPSDQSKWETHYGLLLWFSIVVKIPFHLQRFDSAASEPVMIRILKVCKKYLATTTKAQDMACYLAAVYITRPDVRDVHLPSFLSWIQEVLAKENVQFKKGAILVMAGIFKHGERDSRLIEYASSVLRHILEVEFKSYELPIVKKPLIKLIQRLGMMFLKPRVAAWRYQRGSRSLSANLSSGLQVQGTAANAMVSPVECDDDDDVPEEIEQVLDEILKALRDKNREVQYSAAKGLGRLTNRLSKDFADQVVESVMNLFSLREYEMAWHGGCLALAELARRGLLLPQRLSVVMPVVEQALLYDELRGNYSVGSAVRDAACYLCWALARAYDPSLLQPFVRQLAEVLIISTVFDREVNCRRAAASAFQEHVGRQGTFPHGIDILTTCDYFAVGLRKNAYLNLSLYVAQYEEYRPCLIRHLVERKIMHWDAAIRQLTAETLHKLTFLDPILLKMALLQEILPHCTQQDLHLRLGSILAAGEVINALCQVAEGSNKQWMEEYLGQEAVATILKTCAELLDERYWKSFGGDQMRMACSHFVECLSRGRFPLSQMLVDHWLDTLSKECLASADSNVQQAAVPAITALIGQYFSNHTKDELSCVLERFLVESTGNNQQGRIGNALALGSMPRFILIIKLKDVFQRLFTCALVTDKTLQWADARRTALSSIATIVATVGVSSAINPEDTVAPEVLEDVVRTLLNGLEDYTVDNRGDIGAIVRESAMSSIKIVLELASESNPDFLKPELVRSVLAALAKQATEQIRRTRLLALSVFASLIYCDPTIPHIPHLQELRSIIPPPPVDIATEKECFELWIRVMHLESFRRATIAGFVSSVGSLTESLVKSSSTPFVNYMRHLDTDHLKLVAEDLLEVLRSNFNNVRMMPYIFSCLDHLCSSGCLDPVFKTLSEPLFGLIRAEMSSGSKPLKLLISSIDLYCHMLRGSEATFEKSVNHLLSMLVNRFPRVRKTTASKLYETLLTLTDVSAGNNGDRATLLASNQEEILSILSDTDWDEDVESLKPIRNRLKQLFLPIPSSH